MLGRWILRRWAPSIAAALSLLAPPSSAVHAAPPKVAPLSPQEIFKKYSSAVVQVKTVGRSGTGFIDVVGKVFTAYHVVEGASEVSVILSDGRTLTSRRVAGADRVKDIAILETDLPMSFTRPLLGDYAALQVGEPVTVIGNPLGLSLTLTTGIVSSKRTLGDTDLLQLSAGISPGSSGSPVFNRRGEVVGMVVSTLAAGQQLNFAVSSKDLKSGSVWGVPLTLACSLIQPESEGLLTVSALAFDSSRQDDLLRHEAGGYDGLQQVSVFVEPLPSELQEVTSREELQSWVSDTLRAANLNVVSREQQRDSIRKGSIPKTEREKLTQDDRYCSCIYVNLNAIKTLDHHVVLNCDVEVRRAGVILPGGDTSTITTDLVSCIGSFGDLYADKKGYLRQIVLKELDTVIERWKYAKQGK